MYVLKCGNSMIRYLNLIILALFSSLAISKHWFTVRFPFIILIYLEIVAIIFPHNIVFQNISIIFSTYLYIHNILLFECKNVAEYAYG